MTVNIIGDSVRGGPSADRVRALHVRRAVKAGTRLAEAHHRLGVALLEMADLPGAVTALGRAVALDPKSGRAHTIWDSPDYADAHANLGAELTPTDASEPAWTSSKAVPPWRGEPGPRRP